MTGSLLQKRNLLNYLGGEMGSVFDFALKGDKGVWNHY